MATRNVQQAKGTRKPRVPKVYADEEAIKAQIEAKKKAAGDNPTEAQAKELTGLRQNLGALRFKRLAKQRYAKAVAALRGVAKLGGAGYTRTPEQIAKISNGLVAEYNAAMTALKSTSGKAKEEISIDL